MNDLKKPITIIYEEFVRGISDVINNSGLPPFMIAPVLKDAYRDVYDLQKKQFERDMNEYKKLITSDLSESDKTE